MNCIAEGGGNCRLKWMDSKKFLGLPRQQKTERGRGDIGLK